MCLAGGLDKTSLKSETLAGRRHQQILIEENMEIKRSRAEPDLFSGEGGDII